MVQPARLRRWIADTALATMNGLHPSKLPHMPKNYIKRILAARVYDVAIESPLDDAPLLSARYHNRILLKREDL